MPDYIKNNSKRCNKKINCGCHNFQSFNTDTFGKVIKICNPIPCKLKQNCDNSQIRFNKSILAQQNLYATMRRYPERFPIIDSVKNINLTLGQQRQYSNNWYRQFGTSQAIGVNSNVWGGSYICGSEVPYTN
jgi:hypothetical protein